jgi:hypothetical protein
MLASEVGRAITGQVLDVDGGYRVGFPENPLALITSCRATSAV